MKYYRCQGRGDYKHRTFILRKRFSMMPGSEWEYFDRIRGISKWIKIWPRKESIKEFKRITKAEAFIKLL